MVAKREVNKRLKGIPILNGDVMDVVQNGMASLYKWVSTDLAPWNQRLFLVIENSFTKDNFNAASMSKYRETSEYSYTEVNR